MKELSLRAWAALFIAAFLCACGDKKPASPADSAPPAVQPPSVEYGAANLEEFRLKFRQAIGSRDPDGYRNLHCWEQLPPQIQTALSGPASQTLDVYDYVGLQIDLEPITEADLKQIRAMQWSVTPTHWLIARGEEKGQFRTWRLGEFQGRFYFANEISKVLAPGGNANLK